MPFVVLSRRAPRHVGLRGRVGVLVREGAPADIFWRWALLSEERRQTGVSDVWQRSVQDPESNKRGPRTFLSISIFSIYFTFISDSKKNTKKTTKQNYVSAFQQLLGPKNLSWWISVSETLFSRQWATFQFLIKQTELLHRSVFNWKTVSGTCSPPCSWVYVLPSVLTWPVSRFIFYL